MIHQNKKQSDFEIIELLLDLIDNVKCKDEKQEKMHILQHFITIRDESLTRLLKNKALARRVLKLFNLSWIIDEIPFPYLYFNTFLLNKVLNNNIETSIEYVPIYLDTKKYNETIDNKVFCTYFLINQNINDFNKFKFANLILDTCKNINKTLVGINELLDRIEYNDTYIKTITLLKDTGIKADLFDYNMNLVKLLDSVKINYSGDISLPHTYTLVSSLGKLKEKYNNVVIDLSQISDFINKKAFIIISEIDGVDAFWIKFDISESEFRIKEYFPYKNPIMGINEFISSDLAEVINIKENQKFFALNCFEKKRPKTIEEIIELL